MGVHVVVLGRGTSLGLSRGVGGRWVAKRTRITGPVRNRLGAEGGFVLFILDNFGKRVYDCQPAFATTDVKILPQPRPGSFKNMAASL
jgi:hypothetical protein